MKVFSREKYEESAAYRMSPATKTLRDFIRGTFGYDWTDVCDGMEVIDGKCDRCSIDDAWCIDVPRYKIEIACDDNKVTTAKLIVKGKTVKEATARKHPDDKFDLKIAASIALGRLFEKKCKDERGRKA